MESKGSHQLELSQLQNLLKRDPESYKEEFLQQMHFYDASLQILELNPDQPHPRLQETIFFLAHVSHCFPKELSTFPQQLVDLLQKHATILDPDLRLCLCRALILLRNRQLLRPAALITVFFDLFKCRDKALRTFLQNHIVSDIKGENSRRRDMRLNSELQSFMFRVLNEEHKISSKVALDIMTELYRRHVWHDAKTVNVIVNACFSNVAKIAVTALNFFLGHDEEDEDDDDDEHDGVDESARAKAIKLASLATRVRKKSKKRLRLLENLKKAHKKKKKSEKPEEFNFSALHLIHDPQTFAERLLRQAETTRDRFEVKLLLLDLTSRLIGTHELIVLNFYPHLTRFIQPHQREVLRLLQFLAQASHSLVPPDALQPCVRVIADQFVTERNTSETMAIGLNAVREIARRCPLALDQPLVEDLTAYKTYKDRSVMMAARSLIQLYRQLNPEVLAKKDRGRPTEASKEIETPVFGASGAKNFVPGAETLDSDMDDNVENNEDEEDDEEEGEWEFVIHSSDEEMDDENDKEESEDEDDNDEEDDEDGKEETTKHPKKVKMSVEERRAKASLVTSSRILTDADFKRIDAAQLKKQIHAASGGKRGELKLNIAPLVSKKRSELVDLSAIEVVQKKHKHDKEQRLASIREGRDKSKFGSKKGRANENASTTHREKKRDKNFMMVKHKIKKKAKRSFVQKQRELKTALIRSKKFK